MARQTSPTTQLTKIKESEREPKDAWHKPECTRLRTWQRLTPTSSTTSSPGCGALRREGPRLGERRSRLDSSNERHSGSRTTDLPRRRFVVTVLSSDQRTVTRTMVNAVHDEEVSAGWDGWAPGELIDFIERTCQMPTEIRLSTTTTGFFGAGATSKVAGSAPLVKRPPELGSDLTIFSTGPLVRGNVRSCSRDFRPEARLPPSTQGQATSVAGSRVPDEAEAEEMLAAFDRAEQARFDGLVHRAATSAPSGTR